jgi:hypothetical protein
MTPVSTITTPLPTPSSMSASPRSPGATPRTLTTAGRTASAALAAGDGSCLVFSVCSTALSMSACVSACAPARGALQAVDRQRRQQRTSRHEQRPLVAAGKAAQQPRTGHRRDGGGRRRRLRRVGLRRRDPVTAGPRLPVAACGLKASFKWEDPLLLDAQLTDDERMVREA